MVAAYNIFLITAEYSPDLTGTRHNNMGYMACTDVKFYITYISKSCAVSAIDNFLFTKFRYAHFITFLYIKSITDIHPGMLLCGQFVTQRDITACMAFPAFLASWIRQCIRD